MRRTLLGRRVKHRYDFGLKHWGSDQQGVNNETSSENGKAKSKCKCKFKSSQLMHCCSGKKSLSVTSGMTTTADISRGYK
jgi:hypothetical protein